MVNTKYQIQSAARKLFLEKSFDTVTIDDICSFAGITKSTFYYHFKSKNDLISDFFKDANREDHTLMARIIEEEDYWEQLWLSLGQAPKWAMETGKDLFRHGMINGLKAQKKVFNPQARPNAVALHCSIIRKGQEAGKFKNTDTPEKIYEALFQVFTGTLFEWCTSEENEYDVEKYKQLMMTILGVDN